MARKFRIAAIIVAASAAAVVGVLAAIYVAMQRVEPFYAEALQLEPQAAEAASRETESRATALYSDARKPGQWQATFTDEQINGWMATQLGSESDYPLPADVTAPRLAFGDGTVSLGFRTRQGGVDTVITIDAAVDLTENDEVAVRFTSVKAGALPLPVTQVASKLAAACAEIDLPIRWTHSDSLPVALIDVASNSDRRLSIDAIDLADGALLIAGSTQQNSQSADATPASDDSSAEIQKKLGGAPAPKSPR